MTANSNDDVATIPTVAESAELGRSETMPVQAGSDGRAHGPGSLAGYQLGEVLGRGGMGEVVLASDLTIGRDVAVKRMRATAPTPESIDRFLREAKIQARLDHPAIVPVHELGRDRDGAPYFTMKRLAGVTLQRVLADHAPARTLLRAFVDVCLAIDFAHARGIIHRDLKPANVMLGDYGEVYVLDWGLARVIGEVDDVDSVGKGLSSRDGETEAGAVLGTPGYMSPEQVRGEPVVPASDSYALGAILFEILAGEPLHPRGVGALASTLSEPTGSPSQRALDLAVPPELDAVCVDALALDPARRPGPRALADRVQRYLDGDRDLEQRRALAASHLERARAAHDTGDPERMADAISGAGRALVLDPESHTAVSLVNELIFEPVRGLPRELATRLEQRDDGDYSEQGRAAMLALCSALLFAPVIWWVGIRDLGLTALTFAIVAVMAFNAMLIGRGRRLPIVIALVLGNILLVVLSRVLGSFVLVPGLAAGFAITLVTHPKLVERPVLVIGATVVALMLPLGLEALGVWQRTWQIGDGVLVSRPPAIAFDGVPATVFLIAATVMNVVVMGLFVRKLALTQRKMQHQLEIQAWRLGQLIPNR